MIVDVHRHIGWRPQFTATFRVARDRHDYERTGDAGTWVPCPSCWQQRVAVQKEEDGTWTVLRCGTCLGVGQVLR